MTAGPRNAAAGDFRARYPYCAPYTIGRMSSPADNPQCRPSPPSGIAAIVCEVMELEVRHFAAMAPRLKHVEIMEYGLHNEPQRLRRELQHAIDRVEQREDLDAIALVYGLCSRGTEGISARRCTLVIPRAHDCITLLLGCRRRYADYVARFPGTYWYSPGWNAKHIPPGEDRYNRMYREYCGKYGQEVAEYLMEEQQRWFRTYSRATYVELGVGATPEDIAYTQQCARWLGWTYDYQRGDPKLLADLLAGNWDEDRFVVLPPGRGLVATGDERVIDSSPSAVHPTGTDPPK